MSSYRKPPSNFECLIFFVSLIYFIAFVLKITDVNIVGVFINFLKQILLTIT